MIDVKSDALDVNLHWYGERGIVNALVTHLQRGEQPIEQVRKFLSAIHWATAGRQPWIDSFSRAALIVELGLADFGNPDLMIVCSSGPDDVHCVFVEAKVGMYLASMRSNDDGMRMPGFNSSINGQLSLKYRFARSLHTTPLEALDVAESMDLLQAYAARQKDTRALPRRLAKPTILRDILKPLGLLGLPEERCLYVALTWDSPERAFFDDPLVRKEDGRPVFLSEKGEDLWTTVAERVGWVGYGVLEDALGLSHVQEYKAALHTMTEQSVPGRTDYDAAIAALGESSPETPPLMDRLSTLFTGYEVAKYNGSYSIKDHGQTIAKLIAKGSGVFVGIRDSRAPERWFSGPLEDVSVQGVRFRGVIVPADSREHSYVETLIRGVIET